MSEDEFLRNNTNLDIVLRPWFQDLLGCMNAGKSIEDFISEKDEKQKNLSESSGELKDAKIRYDDAKKRYDKDTEELKNLKKLSILVSSIHNKIKELREECPDSKRDALNSILRKYYYSDGTFDDKELDLQNWKDKLKYSKKIENVKRLLKKLVEQCDAENIKTPEDTDAKRIIEADFCNYDTYYSDDLFQKKTDELTKQTNESGEYYESCTESWNNHFESWKKKQSKENSLIREFVEKKGDPYIKPKSYDVDKFVFGLSNIKDEEHVIFNVGVYCNRIKLDYILSLMGMHRSNTTDGWYYEKSGIGYDADKMDIWSPVMTAKEAKQVLPELLDRLKNIGTRLQSVIPAIKISDISDYISSEQIKMQDFNIENELRGIINFADWDRYDCDEQRWLNLSQEVRKQICDYLGISDIEKKPKEIGLNTTTKEGVLKEFPSDKYLYSGTTVSNDYFSMSRRAGRSGLVYATPVFDYACGYDGAKSGGISATTDKYISTKIATIDGKDVNIGFINVYKRADKQKFYRNFGIEDGVKEEIQENGIYDVETIINNDKNPLVAKYIHLSFGKKDYFIRVPENPSKIISFILQSRRAKLTDTFIKTEIYGRLKKQCKETREGKIPGATSNKIYDSESIKRVISEKLEQYGVPPDMYIMLTRDQYPRTSYGGICEEDGINSRELDFDRLDEEILKAETDAISGSNNGVYAIYFKQGVYVIGGYELRNKMMRYSSIKDTGLGVILSNGDYFVNMDGSPNVPLNDKFCRIIKRNKTVQFRAATKKLGQKDPTLNIAPPVLEKSLE